MAAGPATLLFIPGWLGQPSWWDAQRPAFDGTYRVVQMGFQARPQPSLEGYVADILAAAEGAGGGLLVLVGHSMGGAYALEASLRLTQATAVVLVDTLKDMDKLMTPGQAAALLEMYRSDFKGTVEGFLQDRLFTAKTPPAVRGRLTAEFLEHTGAYAAAAIEPLYQMDLQALAKRVSVPVFGISSDYSPTSVENNRKYFRQYEALEIRGTGHYPMLEDPPAFNAALKKALEK